VSREKEAAAAAKTSESLTDESALPPKVSVIIATYNYSSVLRYAIATVLWQSFRDFELIVVGDCCTDDSEEVVRSFGDARIQWLNLRANSGSKSIPQNAGIERARGEYIAYLAHDDLWHPAHIETLLNAIEESAADFAHTIALYVPPPGETERSISGVFPDKFRAGYALVHSSVIHRKNVVERIGNWPDSRSTHIPGDHLFWTRAADAGLRFFSVPKVTVWKFNASSRPDCYRHRRCDEQAHYFQLIQQDPELAEKELIDVARSAMIHGLGPLETYKVGRDAPPGGHVHRLRQIRGLEPPEPMEMLPPEINEGSFRIEIAEALPGVVAPGARLEFEVRIENSSAFSLSSNHPYPVQLSYHWLNAEGSIAVYDGERAQLIPPLPPASSLHYFMKVQSPKMAGTYQLQLSLVQEKVRWFDGAADGNFPTVEVRPTSPS
jgi:GT2 family glycosyltransferase